MKRLRKTLGKYFLVILVIAILVASAAGGAIADRLFVIRPLDYLVPRGGNFKLGQQTIPQKILQEESVVIDVADKASKSVVTVSITTQRQTLEPFFMDPFGFFNVPRQGAPQTVKQDIGSGFVIDSSGLVVTNKHVVADTNATYKIIDKDDKEYDVEKIYRDPVNDIAILKVSADLPALDLGDSSNLKVGQFVVAIGTALGEFRHTVTTGVISGLGRGIDAGDGLSGFVERLDNVIQTDAAINPGNSGGPLLNSAGQVIGINAAVAGNAQNVGFAIPINVVKDSLKNFNETGQFSRPFLGVRYRIIPRETALLNDVPEGAYVVEVVSGSSAESAGVLPGDIITKLDGQALKADGGGLAAAVSKHKVGDVISAEIFRDGQTLTVQITLQESNQ